ncbi:MAG: pyroglutamyl-peptidase I [Defluviitaleaceae bacterium]|nr:pyroglutamyl-peptidase I [Defluviitaleaceae bacterium]
MKKALITAFDPFGGETINPALEAVMALPNEIDGIKIIKLELPTVYIKSIDTVISALESECPDILIMVGQAGGRPNVTLERVAINIDDATIPDNEGKRHSDTPIVEGGPVAYFSTLPIKDIIKALHKNEIPAAISDSAGTFVCNHVSYGALHYAAKYLPMLKAGFVHIPFAPKQTLNKPKMPSMSKETVVQGLEVIVTAVVSFSYRNPLP